MLTSRRRRSCGSWGNIWLWKAACVFCGGSQIDKNNWLQCRMRLRLRLQCNSSAVQQFRSATVQQCHSAILKLQMQHWRRRRRWRSNSVEVSVWHELQPICSVDEVDKENQKERESGCTEEYSKTKTTGSLSSDITTRTTWAFPTFVKIFVCKLLENRK